MASASMLSAASLSLSPLSVLRPFHPAASCAPPRRAAAVAVRAAAAASNSPAAAVPKKRAATGLTKPRPVSTALQAVVGAAEIPRTEALKRLWAYIKQHNLQVQI
ncbi:hypothetical protein E2562_033196 [Oryza meyeriana var. granulata]|uniref:SWIB domain-containing protein n=1 Tax=Oryza meyeriana var. granulata TaxID=110450 RepID=A0A6G1DRQ7_9ORYZ|nr:hypothetical protein E2562_033196 [Oryza meyeriana var. granulata]